MARVLRYGDVVIAVAVIGMVVMMIVPLPTALLDLLLSFNLTFALVVLLVTMYSQQPLEFSIFPSLLLVTTLFRLALNVSSTRLILLNGFAGKIIQQFAQFVVGGNPVVGFVVFLILVVIQFIVITRGAERVAEVAARFTLDAMPGKQMSIDADLNAGLIDEDEARARRRDIEREADFYGAMDGASKFVKGDAIAGLVIIFINLVGGLCIGTLQRGLSIDDALYTYALLTVGDGLVCQIPALLISTAAGIVVTRAASESNLGRDIISQVASQPRVLAIAAGVLVFFGLVPGLPHLPFFVLAGCVGLAAYAMRTTPAAATDEEEGAGELERLRRPESVLPLLRVDPIEIELGYALLPLADAEQDGDFLDRVVMIRRRLALDLGLVLPPVRVRDNTRLSPNEYVIKIKGVTAGRGELLADHLLAMCAGEPRAVIEGIDTKEPAFGLDALWIRQDDREEAEMAGYTVVDPPSVLTTHLVEVIKAHAAELLGRQQVKELLDAVREESPAVVDGVVPELLTVGDVQRVLQSLLSEGIPIRDMVTILEALGDAARHVKEPDELTEHARRALSRSITSRYVGDDGSLKCITLDPAAEETFMETARAAREGEPADPDVSVLERIIRSLKVQVAKATGRGIDPVVVCSPVVRPFFRRVTARAMPDVPVLSYAELEPETKIESVGMVSADAD